MAESLQAVRAIVLIGHGPIARYVATQLAGDNRMQLAGVICRSGRESSAINDLNSFGVTAETVYTDADNMDTGQFDLAVDCSGHSGLVEHGPALLARGVDLVTIATGVLADPESATRLEQAATAGGSRLRFAIGAIGGIDALLSAGVGHLESVVYTARKPPAGWKGTAAEQRLDLDSLTAATTHFTGSAREAAMAYPRNANVAATVALASLGLDQTQVTLIADPGSQRNCHSVEAAGEFGNLRLELAGCSLAENPKSSALAAMSMVRAVQSLLCDADHAPVGMIGNTLRLSCN